MSPLTALLLAGAVLTGCGGDVGPLNGQLEGRWKRADGLVIEFDGSKAKVADFGDSPLGSNRSLFDTGDDFIRIDSCTSNSCAGMMVVPEYANGVLEEVYKGSAFLEKADRRFTVSIFGMNDETEFTRVTGE